MVRPVFRLCVMRVLALFALATFAEAAPHQQCRPVSHTQSTTSTDLLSNPTTTIEVTKTTLIGENTLTTTATVATTELDTSTYTTTATVEMTDVSTTTATVEMTDVSTTTTTSTSTTVATVSPTPACPTGNLVANPGFEIIGSSWNLGNSNLEMIRPVSDDVPDAHVLSSIFSGPGQTNTFYQVLPSLCPGRTYKFQAEIQMWYGEGTGRVHCYLGQTSIVESEELLAGPWVTISANVVPTATSDVLRCDVISGGETGDRRFVLDDFVFELVTMV